MNKRQKYFSEYQYNKFLKEHDEVIEFFQTNTFQSDSPEEEATIRSAHFKQLALDNAFSRLHGR